MPSLASYTPLETLLIFQSVADRGADPESLNAISASLSVNKFVREDKSYNHERLVPEALRKLYEDLLSQRKTNGVNGHSESRKRKLSTSPTPEDATEIGEELYARYQQGLIEELKADDQQYLKLKGEIEELEKQEQERTETQTWPRIPEPRTEAHGSPVSRPAPIQPHPRHSSSHNSASPVPVAQSPMRPPNEIPYNRPSPTPYLLPPQSPPYGYYPQWQPPYPPGHPGSPHTPGHPGPPHPQAGGPPPHSQGHPIHPQGPPFPPYPPPDQYYSPYPKGKPQFVPQSAPPNYRPYPTYPYWQPQITTPQRHRAKRTPWTPKSLPQGSRLASPERPGAREISPLSPEPEIKPELETRKRKRSISASPAPDPSMVSITKNFARVAAPILNDVNAHKLAGIFSKPLTERDAPGYKNLIYRPQDLKSIKASVGRGSRAANAALEEDDSRSLKKSEDMIPPKAIVNASQLEMEFVRIFANAIMFNPLPASERGFPARFRFRESSSEDVAKGWSSEDGGIIQDAREMFEDVVKSVSAWRSIGQDEAKGGLRGGSVSYSDAHEDESGLEDDAGRKRRKL